MKNLTTMKGDLGAQGPPGEHGEKGDKGERGKRGKRVKREILYNRKRDTSINTDTRAEHLQF